jgi:L-seryl-tRNA(Ser) seleniumtransferase
VDKLARIPKVSELVDQLGVLESTRACAVEAARQAIGLFRAMKADERTTTDLIALTLQLMDKLESARLTSCFNFTGTLLHTGLGRAPLAESAAEAVRDAAGNCLLEFDPDSGERGNRQSHVDQLVRDLTGAEAALVVNNGAGATVLALSALASGAKVLLSRGEMIEIGGSFRLPEIIEHSGAHLVEVGCTNRTHLRDYEREIDDQTAVLLRCHHSNYVISGFTSSPTTADLATLSRKHGVIFIDDLGSGNIVDLTRFGLKPEPRVQDSLREGADLVLFSGDKLLGGPQAGILCGKKELIQRLTRHPLARTLRIDKLCLAALEATLRIHLYGDLVQIPLFEMMGRPIEKLEGQAQQLCAVFNAAEIRASVEETTSMVGAGSAPDNHLPAIAARINRKNPQELAKLLRKHKVIGRIADGALWLDPRSCPSGQFDKALQTLKIAIQAYENGN